MHGEHSEHHRGGARELLVRPFIRGHVEERDGGPEGRAEWIAQRVDRRAGRGGDGEDHQRGPAVHEQRQRRAGGEEDPQCIEASARAVSAAEQGHRRPEGDQRDEGIPNHRRVDEPANRSGCGRGAR